MSRINNVNAMLAARILSQQNLSLNKSLEKLSTGLAINRGADNPTGLVASERLRLEKSQITAAIGNAERASQITNIAEGGLQEINAQLLEIQALVGETANTSGLSQAEKEANQLQVDQILQTIDRIASASSFAGTKLLNGTFDFEVTNQAAILSGVTVNGAKISEGSNLNVSTLITASSQNAALFLSTGGVLDLTANSSTFVFELAGTQGTREFSFASGTTQAAIVLSINAFKTVTGISASVQGTGVVLKNTSLGSADFVSVEILDDAGQAGAVHFMSSNANNTVSTVGSTTFAAASTPIRDEGQDISVFINGIEARGKGRIANIITEVLDAQVTFTLAGSQATGATATAFRIDDGGAKFNFGPSVDVGNQVRLGIKNVAARKLGSNLVGGFLDDLGSGKSLDLINGNLETAQVVVNEAITQLSSLRGRLGAFQSNVVGSTIRSLGVTLENISAAESVIRDTDFAQETSNLTRSQILVNAATRSLVIANTSSQNILALLQ